MRTAASAQVALRWWLCASARSEAAASLITLRRRSVPMFWPLRVDRRRGADVRLRRHREHVGRLRDPDAGRGGARARPARRRRSPGSSSASSVWYDLLHRAREAARRVEQDHGRVVAVLRARRSWCVNQSCVTGLIVEVRPEADREHARRVRARGAGDASPAATAARTASTRRKRAHDCKDSIRSRRFGLEPERWRVHPRRRGHELMKSLCAAVLAALALPGAAQAGAVDRRARRPAPRAARGRLPSSTPRASTSSACTGGATGASASARARSRAAGAAGGPPTSSPTAPTRAASRSAARRGWRIGEPVWVGRSNAIQYAPDRPGHARRGRSSSSPPPPAAAAPRLGRRLAADHRPPRLERGRVDPPRAAALRRRAPARGRPPHGRLEHVHAARSRPRSCAGSRSTT